MKILKTKKYSILSNILRYSFVAVFALMLFAPVVFINAQTCADGTVKAVCPDGGGSNIPDGGGTNITNTIVNPLGSDGPQNIPDFIAKLLDIVVIIGIPIVTLAIIYAGFLFVQAQGNPEALKKAKSTLLYTLIGATLLLGAFVIAAAIGSTVDDITSTT
jgi:hypothetical protein